MPASGSEKAREVIGGSDVYADGSRVCWAAIHACKTTATGGSVTVTVVSALPADEGQPAYEAPTANGVSCIAKMQLEAQGASDEAIDRVIERRAAELVASRRLWE